MERFKEGLKKKYLDPGMKMYGLKDEGQTMQMISNNISNSLSAYRRRLSKITDRAADPKNTTP